MKIVVLAKHVPDATGSAPLPLTAQSTAPRVTDCCQSWMSTPWNKPCRLPDELDDVEVVVMTLGPEDAADAIKRALQMGASAAIHIIDDAVHGSDALATSAILAEAIKKAAPDLVICGMASTDGTMGVVPAMIAERLSWPAATLGATLSVADDQVTIRRDDDVASLTIEASLPAIVSVTDQSGEARYPSMRGILAAKKKPVESWTLADLGIEPTSVGLNAAWSKVLQRPRGLEKNQAVWLRRRTACQR